MGLTKTQIFTDEQNELAQLAKTLGHPARIAILQHIMQANACICGDLVKEIGLAQATISQHLRELKNQGFIKGTIDGTSVCYCINQPRLKSIVSLLNTFLGPTKSNKINCC